MVWRCLGSKCKLLPLSVFFFFFNDTATTEIYTLSLHDALPICCFLPDLTGFTSFRRRGDRLSDRKSTRLNSSHGSISYAVFCLKKKKNNTYIQSSLGRTRCNSPIYRPLPRR